MTVFEAFPKAIVSNIWQLGQRTRNTETGVAFMSLGYKDVIVDGETSGDNDTSPNASLLESGSLLYAKPSQLPTLNASALVSDYLWFNSVDGDYYAIERVELGKNQEEGVIEHVQFSINPVGVVNG